MNTKFIAVRTETEILGAIDDVPKIQVKEFDREVTAFDCIRKWFVESCREVIGLCFARFSENAGKICGECTVITVGVCCIQNEN